MKDLMCRSYDCRTCFSIGCYESLLIKAFIEKRRKKRKKKKINKK